MGGGRVEEERREDMSWGERTQSCGRRATDYGLMSFYLRWIHPTKKEKHNKNNRIIKSSGDDARLYPVIKLLDIIFNQTSYLSELQLLLLKGWTLVIMHGGVRYCEVKNNFLKDGKKFFRNFIRRIQREENNHFTCCLFILREREI